MKAKLFILFLMFSLIACEKNSETGFTNKWWKLDGYENVYIRFDSDGSYTKEMEMVIYMPTYINSFNRQKVVITGNWNINSDKITFETAEFKNAGIMYNNVDTGRPNFYFYGTIGYDSISSSGEYINPRWNQSTNDSIPFRPIINANDYTAVNTSETIWVLKSVREDTLELIINSKTTKFTYDRDKE